MDEPELTEKKPAEPLPVDAEDRWDWEFYQEPPPPKNRRTIRVQFRYKRQAEPMPYPDPEVERMSENNIIESTERPKTIKPSPVSEEDVERDDVVVPTPPPRRSGTIKVRLKYMGRSKPIPADDPSDD